MTAILIAVGAAFLELNHSTVNGGTPPVGAVWYLWYGSSRTSGLGSPGWNSSNDPGGGSVVDKPAIGYYSSDSNQTFAWQVGMMQRAGLSFAVVSWWGPNRASESGAINNATHHLFAYLESINSSFKIAIMVDAYNQTHSISDSSLAHDYSYIYSSFIKPFGNWYFEWQGKPLLLFFNPVYPAYSNDTFSIRTIGNRPNPVDWTFWNAPASYFDSQAGPNMSAANDEGSPVISQDGEVTIVPRIDSYYQFKFGFSASYLRFDQSLTKGLYQEQWNFVLSNEHAVKLVLIYSWNEYHERTAIEPHFDATANVSVSYLSDMTASYIVKL